MNQAWGIGIPDTFIAPCSVCDNPDCYSHYDEGKQSMKPGTYAVYTISVSKSTYTIRDVLKQAIPETFWRGDAEEAAWQAELRRKMNAADDAAALIIESAEWTPAPGYPQGDLSL